MPKNAASGNSRESAGPGSRTGSRTAPYDFIGVGFGPSNLALAIAAEELDATRECVFFERNAKTQWHPGMLIDGARMQISFLKDLVLLRNPASPYTFLQYTKAKERLERFVNLGESRVTRIEYQDYLEWVAEAFATQVRYDSEVVSVHLVPRSADDGLQLFEVTVRDLPTGDTRTVFARNVVHAAGGRPRLPEQLPDVPTAVHSSRFLPHFPAQFTDHDRAYDFAVVGDGQSAGEIVAYLLEHYPRAHVHLTVSGYSLKGTDNSPFVNELFHEKNADDFYDMDHEQRAALRSELRPTNYGVVEAGFLDDLYRKVYADEVKGGRRLTVHACSRLEGVHEDGGRLRADVRDRFSGVRGGIPCDGIVLATGYDRELDPRIFGDVLPLLCREDSGELALTRNYRVRMEPEAECGLYVQGYGEYAFGLGDTLLSLLPFRSKQIFTDICKRTPPLVGSTERARTAAADSVTLPAYPPEQFVEEDTEKIYSVISRFHFATVISTRGPDDPIVSHIPLTLDRTRGGKGVLFGHMDRSNPHVPLLDDRDVMVLFHGPNSYISPYVYKSDRLPTWNSMTVHVRGHARLLTEGSRVVEGLCGISEHADPGAEAYRLDPRDERIGKLIDYIVGFEIDIEQLIGRFKLSQDMDDEDRRRAAQTLLATSRRGEERLIEDVVGLAMSPKTPVPAEHNGNHAEHNGTHAERNGNHDPIVSWRA
ncbi:SidA/IucD/PvdA family monooxygenase [Streptomyces sp. NPDC054796]